MSVTNLWPLFLLLLVPVIIVLYILKQKGIDEEVGSTMLWQETIKNTEATTPWEKYKHNILMYLQILTVLLLAFGLMAPFLKTGGRDFSQVILVLDDSASMNSIYVGERTRFDEAKARAKDYIDSLNENCAITVISATGGGEILASNVDNKQSVKAVIDKMRCTELAGTLEDCINMVGSVSAQWERYGITMFTDAPVMLDEMEATVVNLNTEGENMAVNYVSYSTDEDGALTVLAKISNFGAVEGSREINLYGDGELLDIKNVTVPAGDSAVVYFEDVSFEGRLLEAEINEKDMLPNDNRAGVIVNENGQKRVLLVTGGNTFLEKALSAVSNLDIYKTTELSVIGENEVFDLYIFDNTMPETLPKTGNLVFINPDEGAGVTVDTVREGVRLSFVPSDLSDFLENSSFGVNSAKILNRPAWATAFLVNGEDCCGYYGENGERKILALGFDIHETDFALQADFPIMIFNIINYAIEGSLTDVSGCLTGDKVTVNSRGHDSDIEITMPDGEKTILEASLTSKVFTDVNYAGLYTVSQSVEGETFSGAFYAGFPVEAESGQKGSMSVEGATVGSDEKPSGGRELRNVILCLLLGLLVLEWLVYVREY